MTVIQFVHETSWADLPEKIRHQARRCLLDTAGSAIGGRSTPLSSIVHDFAATVYGGTGGRLWLDGRDVSPPGAALANGMTIDALDIHDGYTLTKGHAGAALIPAVFSMVSTIGYTKNVADGREFLTTLVVGYEIALRAGLALHATAKDYHTSGAWNALGCAAMTARRLGLSGEKTRHALGIAEYHGPRSPMMRCIDHPAMVKDGSGWGAMTGVSAALFARAGFTGAPADTVESTGVAPHWDDLGRRWLINEQYFKPHAVCRWAQPAITGALALKVTHQIRQESIERIRVTTFHEAIRLAKRRPQNTEEAQYSLPYPVAAAVVFGRLGPAELEGAALENEIVLQLADRIELVEEPAYNDRFPANRFARVQIDTVDGSRFDSGPVEATWSAEDPPTDNELSEKFRWLAGTSLSPTRVSDLEKTIWRSDELDNAAEIQDLLSPPADNRDGTN